MVMKQSGTRYAATSQMLMMASAVAISGDKPPHRGEASWWPMLAPE